MQNLQQEVKKEELIVFKYKREPTQDLDQDTLVFNNRSKRMASNVDSIDKLVSKMSKVSIDDSIFCLKKLDVEIEPAVQKLIFRTGDLQMERRRQIRNDLIKGLRSKNFPSTIKVCEIQDDWVPYKPSPINMLKQKVMQVEPIHDYYILARDVLDQEKEYQQIDKPRQLIDYIGESQGEIDSQQMDSQDSNRQDNPDNDYPQEDYDFDQQDDQQNYGEYNPYDDYDEDWK